MAISCDTFRQNFKRHIVDTLFDQFNNLSTNNWFVSIGQPLPWPGATTGLATDEGETPLGEDTEFTETNFWQNVIAHKRVTNSDISMVIPKYDWISNKVYIPYRNNIDLFSDTEIVEFYVVVDDERVYKCIDNNYGAKSTVPPTHTDSTIRKLSDNYRWKFMFSIPESKRKFITTTSYSALNEIERLGHIPVDYVKFLKLNDDRVLQWQTQQAATKGAIDFTELNQNYQPFLISTNCLLSTQSSNTISAAVSVGATTFNISSTELYNQNNYYKDMVLMIDSGAGEGQRRIIKSYTTLGSGSGTVVVDPLSVALVAATSKFSIVPNIFVDGDGSSRNNALNPTTKTADITPIFGSSVSGSANQTYIDSFEMVDTGKNYTYAQLKVIKGLTFSNLYSGNIADIGTPIISPYNGHGSNAVAELGAAKLMVVVEYNQTENGILTVNNDFRQFGILKNPLLKTKIKKLRLVSPSTENAYIIGNSIVCGTGGSVGSGKISYWSPGVVGYTGSAELVVTGLSGNFPPKHKVSSVGVTGEILDSETIETAGSEARKLLKLKISSLIGNFSDTGTEFRKGLWVSSVGNPEQQVKNTRFTASIYRWEPSPESQTIGYLYLENPNGRPLLSEGLIQCDFYMRPTASLTGTGMVVDIDEIIEETKDLYDQTLSLKLQTTEGTPFVSSTFSPDTTVQIVSGATSQGFGKVLDWEYISGIEGNLTLFSTQNSGFTVGSGLTFAYDTTQIGSSTISAINHIEDLQYKTGELEYIQNTNAISRNIDQREEIKILFEI